MSPEIEQLIHDVLHGEASEAQCQRLSDWVTASESNAAAYLRVAMDERAMRSNLEREAARSLQELSKSPDDSGAGMLLAELARAEANAHPPLVELIDLRTTWLADHARPLMAAAGVALAAVVAVVVTLLASGPSARTAPMASDWSLPQSPHAERVVAADATLTAQRGAVWQGVAGETMPQVGDGLMAGSRLVLAQGVAEITTKRGAIAIIEGPCRLQVVGDNALRLERGKLLGICETQASKGFVVRTPHMDVTDLGTRFGVDATDAEATQVHVLQGEVRVARPSRSGEAARSETLTQGRGLIAYAGEEDMRSVAVEPGRFASITPQQIDLLGTGRGLSMNETDPNWRVIAVDGQRLTTPEILKVGAIPSGGTADLPGNDPETSQWLRGDHIDIARDRKEILFTCRTRFELPADIDAETARLVLRFDADARVDQVRINGRAVTPSPNSFNDDFVDLNTLIIPGPLAVGINTLELDVVDLVRNSGPQWGMRAQVELEDFSRPAP